MLVVSASYTVYAVACGAAAQLTVIFVVVLDTQTAVTDVGTAGAVERAWALLPPAAAMAQCVAAPAVPPPMATTTSAATNGAWR